MSQFEMLLRAILEAKHRLRARASEFSMILEVGKALQELDELRGAQKRCEWLGRMQRATMNVAAQALSCRSGPWLWYSLLLGEGMCTRAAFCKVLRR